MSYWCGLIFMMDMPVLESPFIIAWTTGEAPLHLGNILPCTFSMPLKYIKAIKVNDSFLSINSLINSIKWK